MERLPSPADPALSMPPLHDGRTDRLRSLYAHSGSSLVGNALGAGIVAALFLQPVGAAVVGAWLAAFVLVWAARLALAIGHRRVAATARRDDALWQRGWLGAALASAALWGIAGACFAGRGAGWHDVALMLVVNGLCVGSIPSLAPHGSVFVGYAVLALVPLVVRIALGGQPEAVALAALLLAILATALLLGRDYRAAFDRLLALKAQTERLGAQLRRQTDVAERARRDAEAANRAKSQFFAAASHDLRQPLHAIGLFVHALRGGAADAATRQLLDRLDRAVAALDALFAELLDLRRIDAGGTERHDEDFAFDALLQRARLHFEPLAFDKGLALRLRGGRQRAHADPLIVERILRNLVANAIRYTDDGGVLVAVRRRGADVLLQVWDSGVGIAAADQARVFDEFVRLDVPQRRDDAERRNGLGMGLAIVRRLAALLDAPLALRSVPGRGSVFSVRLRGVGACTAAVQACASIAAPPGAPARQPDVAQVG